MMFNFAAAMALPDVRSAVHGDTSGAHMESINEPDGESIAAVAGFTIGKLVETGGHLGLGSIQRVSSSSKTRAFALFVYGESVVTVHVDHTKPIGPIEKKIDDHLQRHMKGG
jgi:hypothetical protein